MTASLNLYQTVALAAIVYYIGSALRKRLAFFQRFCIPAPVIGGIIFAVLSLILHSTGLLFIEFDITLQNVFMTAFFTSIGFTASFRLLKRGGLQVFIFLFVATLLVIFQNTLGVWLANIFGLNPLLGLCTGSIPMVGGHGTSAAFGPLLEGMGITGASTVAVASATFGLIAGSAIGGPIANLLVKKHRLAEISDEASCTAAKEKASNHTEEGRFISAVSLLFLAMGAGSYISELIQSTGLTFPSYVGAMLAACIIRNISDLTHKKLPEFEIATSGSVGLAMFLSMALMSLKLWELAELALPMIIMLLAQTALVALFTYFITFNIMGRDYEAAVISAANCGFGMGATPNAMANMQAVTCKFGVAPKAFFIVPLVGGLFIDFANTSILTMFINFLSK